MKIIFVLTLLILITGCADLSSKGVKFTLHDPIDNDTALAYFIQPKIDGVTSCLLVGVDGKNKECIGYPGYANIYISKGKHTISFTPNSLIKIANLEFDFDFDSNKAYYFEYQLLSKDDNNPNIISKNYIMILDYYAGWVLIEEDIALKKLAELRKWN